MGAVCRVARPASSGQIPRPAKEEKTFKEVR
jgi:hypothetical protein